MWIGTWSLVYTFGVLEQALVGGLVVERWCIYHVNDGESWRHGLGDGCANMDSSWVEA
jgi:hypothetical protein